MGTSWTLGKRYNASVILWDHQKISLAVLIPSMARSQNRFMWESAALKMYCTVTPQRLPLMESDALIQLIIEWMEWTFSPSTVTVFVIPSTIYFHMSRSTPTLRVVTTFLETNTSKWSSCARLARLMAFPKRV